MRPGDELHVSRTLGVARPDHRDTFVRDDEGDRRAAQVIDRLLENAFEVVRTVVGCWMIGRSIG